MSTHHIALGESGDLVVTLDEQGVVLDDLRVAPGWHVVRHTPRPSWWARRLGRGTPRPASHLAVELVDRPDRDGARWEAEISRRDDGVWELAENVTRHADPARTVVTGGGEVGCHLDGARLVVRRAEPSPGWSMWTQAFDDDGELHVTFTRGSEVWEVIISLDPAGEEPAIVEVEHSWTLPGT